MLYIQYKKRSISKSVKPKHVFDLPDRLHKKWEEKMMKRRLKALLILKRFDPEQIAMKIKPEKDRQAYNAQKKRAIEEQFRRIHHEISEIRARLIPPKDVDHEAERLNFITTNVENMLTTVMDGFEFDVIKTELDEKVGFFIHCRIWSTLYFRKSKLEYVIQIVYFFSTFFSMQLDASKADAITINWHELLDRAQITRSKVSKAIFEKRRKAYIGKAAKIDAKMDR